MSTSGNPATFIEKWQLSFSKINAMTQTSNLSNGRVVIPAALRHQLDIHDGDQLIWSVREGELVATTRRSRLEKAQALFQSFVPRKSASLADELIGERHAASEIE